MFDVKKAHKHAASNNMFHDKYRYKEDFIVYNSRTTILL